jgi:hypothetical protein
MNGGSRKDRFDQHPRQSAEGAAIEGNLAGVARFADLFGVSDQISLHDLEYTGCAMITGHNHPLIAVNALERTSGMGKKYGINHFPGRHFEF